MAEAEQETERTLRVLRNRLQLEGARRLRIPSVHGVVASAAKAIATAHAVGEDGEAAEALSIAAAANRASSATTLAKP